MRQLREMHSYAGEADNRAAAAAAQQEAEPLPPFAAAPLAGSFLAPKLEPGRSIADTGCPSRSNLSNNNTMNGGGGSGGAVTTGGHAQDGSAPWGGLAPQGGGASWRGAAAAAELPKPRQPMSVVVNPTTSHTRVQHIGALSCPVPCCGLPSHLSHKYASFAPQEHQSPSRHEAWSTSCDVTREDVSTAHQQPTCRHSCVCRQAGGDADVAPGAAAAARHPAAGPAVHGERRGPPGVLPGRRAVAPRGRGRRPAQDGLGASEGRGCPPWARRRGNLASAGGHSHLRPLTNSITNRTATGV